MLASRQVFRFRPLHRLALRRVQCKAASSGLAMDPFCLKQAERFTELLKDEDAAGVEVKAVVQVMLIATIATIWMWWIRGFWQVASPDVVTCRCETYP